MALAAAASITTAASTAMAPSRRRPCDEENIPVVNDMLGNDPTILGLI
jgi:hypothetical protein